MPDPTGWVTLALAAIVGSTIGGVAGFGTGVIMIPAIAWVVGVKSTVPVLTVCMLLGNSARVWFSRDEIEWRVVSAFLLGAVPMTIVCAPLYTHIEGRWLSRMMGAFMILAVPLRRGLAGRRRRAAPSLPARRGFLRLPVGPRGLRRPHHDAVLPEPRAPQGTLPVDGRPLHGGHLYHPCHHLQTQRAPDGPAHHDRPLHRRGDDRRGLARPAPRRPHEREALSPPPRRPARPLRSSVPSSGR